MILVFDVGDTLVYKEPTQDKVIADRFMQVGISLTEQEARCMHQITELRIAEQIWRENQGVPRMEDQEFFSLYRSINAECAVDCQSIDQ